MSLVIVFGLHAALLLILVSMSVVTEYLNEYPVATLCGLTLLLIMS
ncbi:hypothetical protein [Thalassotalea maritima]